ncbi:MAG: Hint domain-containing protein, partial [Pseudomonadota bacterium]
MRLVIEDLETADEDVAFDNITITGDPVCFTRGAMIATPEGPRAIETLAAGDLVITRDHGAQPLRWVGSRRVLAEEPALRPVRIRAGALGQGLPERDLVVSRHHGMLVTGWRAALLFDAGEALVAAVDLVNDSTITLEPAGEVEYFHLLFDAHQIVMAEGAWTESYKPLARDLSFFNAAQEREILGLFPELELAEGPAFASARPVASKRDAALFS